MNIDLLSQMIRELILEHDSVALPGLGTFFATVVPASFSDKGFTINPPYRRLTFIQGEADDGLIVALYAQKNSLDQAEAKAVIHHFLNEVRDVLKNRKSITLSGLGRLRATKDNNFFFVANPDIDIYPEGFGLPPVSLRNIYPFEDEPMPEFKDNEIPAPAESAESERPTDIAEPAEAEVPEATIATEVIEKPADIAETAVNDRISDDSHIERRKETIETQEAEQMNETVETTADERESDNGQQVGERSRWWIWPVAIIGAAALALGLFLLLAHIAPDFIDSILYTKEELELIKGIQ